MILKEKCMLAKAHIYLVVLFTVGIAFVSGCKAANASLSSNSSNTEISERGSTWVERRCISDDWQKISFDAVGHKRSLLYKGPGDAWRKGVIIVLHGGGGEASHFCSGRRIVKSQIDFTDMALARGFAVILLDSTRDVVTDAQGRACGKRFDFSVLNRPNIDLPYIGQVLDDIIPSKRPPGSSQAVFITGLSTGGYMTIRAATHFDNQVTAFAPVSAGDPFGTDTICDTSLSKRKSAKGILVDRETRRQIIENNACNAPSYPNESMWLSTNPPKKPVFKQFQDASDGIVDLSCMKKAGTMLVKQGYIDRGAFIIPTSGKKDAFKHLWQDAYNKPILDFFESEVNR